ncbi:MAG: hypothetical protein JW867_04850 [Candidatus Omnitrophica bacterium]|nr:hypothetical protein [Candidatus Omnitrophota bacterium]
MFFETSPHALTLTSFLLKPFVSIFWVWGFPVFQSLILAYSLVMLLKYFRKNLFYGLISLFFSGISLLTIAVLSDVYTSAGLLALFLILRGDKDLVLYAILAISFIAHYGNIALFPLTGFIWWQLFERREVGRLMLIAGLFLFLVLLSASINYFIEGEFRFFPEKKYSFLTARIITDAPETFRSYIKEAPDSSLAKNKDVYEDMLGAGRGSQAMLWHAGNFLDRLGNKDQINRETKRFLIWSVKNRSGALARISANNTYHLLMDMGCWFILKSDSTIIRKHMNQFMPRLSNREKQALVTRYGYNIRFLSVILKQAYYLSYLVNIIGLSIAFFCKKFRNSQTFPFLVFSSIAFLINGFFMANFSGIFLRYLIRIMLLPLFSSVLVLSYFFSPMRINRDH